MQASCASKMDYDRQLSTVSAQRGTHDSSLLVITNA